MTDSPDASRGPTHDVIKRAIVDVFTNGNERYIDQPEHRRRDYDMAADAVVAALAARPVAETGGAADATYNVGRWLSAALDDPQVCAEMKADILAWMEAGKPNIQPGPAVGATPAVDLSYISQLIAENNELKGPPDRQALDAAIKTRLKARGLWVEAYPEERESGVIVDPGMSQEWADNLNADSVQEMREDFEAISKAIIGPSPSPVEREALARTLEIAWVEATGHHPVGRMYESIKHLFPVMADAALASQPAPSSNLQKVQIGPEQPAQAGETWRYVAKDEPPADEDVIMGWWNGFGQWSTHAGYWRSTRGGWIHGQATHWMPLPKAPDLAKDRADG